MNNKIFCLATVFSGILMAHISMVQASGFDVPAEAQMTVSDSMSAAFPSGALFSDPLADPDLGKTLMGVEMNPPAVTRGSGGQELERLFAARCRSVVFIAHKVRRGGKASVSTGTGSIVSIKGYILTAAHVVKGSRQVVVGIFPSCKPGTQPELFKARVVRTDPSKDLALLKLTTMPYDIATMPIGRMNEVRTGSSVIIIGHPRRLFMSLSEGTVSAIRPNYKFLRSRATVIQTDGAINPGNSGGPMLSDKGNLIGVNSFIYGKASAGLNFAVAVTDVRDFLSGKKKKPVAQKKKSNARIRQTSKCNIRFLKKVSKKKATYKFYDSSCNGKADTVVIKYDDSSKKTIMAMDRNNDGKYDVKFILNKKGKPVLSSWDDDFDGEDDYMGKHRNGSFRPYKKVSI